MPAVTPQTLDVKEPVPGAARISQDTLPLAGPAAVWLCAGFLLAGMGTVMLGPVLPYLAHRWHMQDVDSGLLLFAKFTGAFVGGVSAPRRLGRGILGGLLAAGTGFAAFACTGGPYTAAMALFVCGIGLGLLIASTNILAGLRYSARPGAALASINFFWSLGAVATGLLVGALLPGHSLSTLLLAFAALFAFVALGGAARPTSGAEASAESGPTELAQLSRASMLLFGGMLFFYGGLETCLTQWLTTYSIRYTTGQVLGGQSAMVVLWVALTAGRALTALLLRRMRELTLQRSALAATAVLIPVLLAMRTARGLAVVCVLLGLSLAPFFPAVFGILMRRRPSARVAGTILAVSGLGAAGLTWLMGFLSTRTGSLREAMAVPMAAALVLLAMSFAPGLRHELRSRVA